MNIDNYIIECYIKNKEVEEIKLDSFDTDLLKKQLKEGHIVFTNKNGGTEIININKYDKIKIYSNSINYDLNYLFMEEGK